MSRELFGLYYGVVQKGEDPDKLGRFRVKLHDDIVTDFAHVLMPMGWYTLPDTGEQGDKVVVVFIGGNPEHPVIVGGVWNDAKRPPEVNEDGKNNFRGYRSRCGHRLIFDDSDKSKIVLADKTQKNVVGIGNFAKAGAGKNVCEVFRPLSESKSGVAISACDSDAALEITCKGNLSVTGQNIKINADSKLEVKADGDVAMTGTTAKISSSSQLNDDLKLEFI